MHMIVIENSCFQANRGLGLTAHIIDHCNVILKFPQGTNSTWVCLSSISFPLRALSLAYKSLKCLHPYTCSIMSNSRSLNHWSTSTMSAKQFFCGSRFFILVIHINWCFTSTGSTLIYWDYLKCSIVTWPRCWQENIWILGLMDGLTMQQKGLHSCKIVLSSSIIIIIHPLNQFMKVLMWLDLHILFHYFLLFLFCLLAEEQTNVTIRLFVKNISI